LNIEWFDFGQMNVKVYDLCGKLLIAEQTEASATQLHIQAISAGTYFLQLTNAAGNVMKQQFVKQ
jgi:hypothetical protein